MVIAVFIVVIMLSAIASFALFVVSINVGLLPRPEPHEWPYRLLVRGRISFTRASGSRGGILVYHEDAAIPTATVYFLRSETVRTIRSPVRPSMQIGTIGAPSTGGFNTMFDPAHGHSASAVSVRVSSRPQPWPR